MRAPEPPETRSKQQDKDLFAENEVGGALYESGRIPSAFTAANAEARKRKIREVLQDTGVNERVALEGASPKEMAKGTRGAASGAASSPNTAKEVVKTVNPKSSDRYEPSAVASSELERPRRISRQPSSAVAAGRGGSLTNNGTSSRFTVQFAAAQAKTASSAASAPRPILSDAELHAVRQKVRFPELHL